MNTGILSTSKKSTKSTTANKSSNSRRILPDGRLFAITGKELQNYFKELVHDGWLTTVKLKKNKQHFQKVAIFPTDLDPIALVDNSPIDTLQTFLRPEINDWLRDFHQPINGTFRSKAHLEYIIPSKLSDHIRQLQIQLKDCWSQSPVPPIRLWYYSAHLNMDESVAPLSLLVYPVRLDYLQRATYLYAYGQHPDTSPLSDTPNAQSINWYDYRMDRIVSLEPLTWGHPEIPTLLLEKFKRQHLPTVKDLDQEQSDVWGYDLHRPATDLLVRFDRYFHAQYVAQTERTALLRPLENAHQARALIRATQLTKTQKETLLAVVSAKEQDIYCRVQHRQNDYNITMRMRAWGPKVEVLLPWNLRQTMINDIQALNKLYL